MLEYGSTDDAFELTARNKLLYQHRTNLTIKLLKNRRNIDDIIFGNELNSLYKVAGFFFSAQDDRLVVEIDRKQRKIAAKYGYKLFRIEDRLLELMEFSEDSNEYFYSKFISN